MPAWLKEAMGALQTKYPDDKFEVILRKVATSPSPEWRIKCLDCPGKVSVPPPFFSSTMVAGVLMCVGVFVSCIPPVRAKPCRILKFI